MEGVAKTDHDRTYLRSRRLRARLVLRPSWCVRGFRFHTFLHGAGRRTIGFTRSSASGIGRLRRWDLRQHSNRSCVIRISAGTSGALSCCTVHSATIQPTLATMPGWVKQADRKDTHFLRRSGSPRDRTFCERRSIRGAYTSQLSTRQ
jgi:hypothetical protein